MLRTLAGGLLALSLSLGLVLSGPAADRKPAPAPDDAVARAILDGPTQPRDIYEVRARLLKRGGKLRTFLLANRGHDNPSAGSFSFFEVYSGPMKGGTVREGELFIGFFSARDGKGALHVRQDTEDDGALLIELVAWDYSRKQFNYWELLAGKKPDWHFVGSTSDILENTADVYTGKPGVKVVAKPRCAACHTLGGPVMKELPAPHNDWITAGNKLFTGKLTRKAGKGEAGPYHVADRLFSTGADARDFAKLVKGGIDRLVEARAARKWDGQTLRQQLRSLFCTMEMNLVTDTRPLAHRRKDGTPVEAPAEFFADARLTGATKPVPVAVKLYDAALMKVGTRFATDDGSLQRDSHHAFSVPARSYMDNHILTALVKQGMLDDELIADVLAVDFTRPVYSPARAGLVRHVPESARDVKDLREKLIAALKAAKDDPAAKELLSNLTDPKRTAAFHRKRALAYLASCRTAASSPAAVEGWVRLALQRRNEVLAAPTAFDEKENVLEPGFKVLFPMDGAFLPGKLSLDEKGAVVAGK